MGRIIIQGLKFLATALLVYLVLFFTLTHTRLFGKQVIYRTNDYYQWKGGVAYAKFKEWAEGQRYDAVVIGSSHAYRGYDPRVFEARGYRMFNLGSSAQTPLSTYAILEECVTKDRTPLVIIDLYENSFDQEGIESVSDLTQNMSSDRAAFRLAASLHDLRGLNMFTLRMMNKNGPSMWADPDYKAAGSAIKADSTRKDVKYDVGRKLRLNERQKECFVKCLDLCAERGIRVVLSTHCYPHQSDHVRHAAFAAFVDSVLATRGPDEDLRWLDFAYDHDLNDHDHFFDHNHLNAAGARIFNERLVDSLVANGYLPRR
jgi:hypothetical protein